MAKKEKIELTPEERLGLEETKKAKRKIFGETFLKACALFLAVVLVYSVTYVAIGGGRTVYEVVQSGSGSVGGGAASVNSNNPGGAQSADANAPASNEAEEAAKAINAATAAGATAGYKWVRTSDYTQPIDVGGATDTLNKVIHMADPNANLDSVVGGFIGIGKKEATINKGEDAATVINYHGDSYKLKATQLKAGDLQNLKVDGDNYSFTLPDCTNLVKDGSTPLSRLTDDIVIQSEIDSEIKQFVSVVSVNSLVGTYSNIKVTAVITDGKLQSMTYSYDATVQELGLKALGIPITGKGAMHTEATYSDFVY